MRATPRFESLAAAVHPLQPVSCFQLSAVRFPLSAFAVSPPADLIDDLRLLEPPGPWWTSWWALALVTVVVCATAFWIWRLRSGRGGALGDQVVPTPEKAHEDALVELQKLFAMIEEERSRSYAIEASAIVRRYIERRFEIRAPMRATEEFLYEAQRSPKLAADWQQLLGRFLGCCDFLKFARGSATRAELEELHQAAVKFVSETRSGDTE